LSFVWPLSQAIYDRCFAARITAAELDARLRTLGSCNSDSCERMPPLHLYQIEQFFLAQRRKLQV